MKPTGPCLRQSSTITAHYAWLVRNSVPEPTADPAPATDGGAFLPVVGVGPWDGEWPEGEHWDRELLATGDTRNVVDEYRYWTHEAIVADLDERRHGFHVAIENWKHDLNIGSVVRTANAFLAKEVHRFSSGISSPEAFRRAARSRGV